MKVKDPIKPIGDSFIGWLGGKTRLRPTIINVLPRHECYVEVFAGSATVFFGKPHEMSRIEIVNDIDGELVNLMKVLAGTYFDEKVRQEFIGYVRDMPAARKPFQEWQKWLNASLKGDSSDLDKLSSAQRAFVFYYCTKKGFSSVAAGGYEASPFSGSRYNQKTDFKFFTERFRVNNAQIESLPFEELITKYNRPKGESVFFCDPPYWVANDTNYYRFVFNHDDHLKFKDCCDKINKNGNRFLITYDDVQEIIDLYKDYNIYRTDEIIYSSADERGERELKKTELFITNYDIAEVVLDRNQNKGNVDLFAELDATDHRIEVPGHIGLEKI